MLGLLTQRNSFLKMLFMYMGNSKGPTRTLAILHLNYLKDMNSIL